jgi:peptidoglycan hydrolase CwlO-like protein
VSADDPTRPLGPPADRPAVREREYATTTEDPLWREELLDRLRSLRTAVALLGVLAVAALGVAIWALLTADDAKDQRGGSNRDPRVAELQNRVDDLESKLDKVPTQSDLSDLRDRQNSLDDGVKQVGSDVKQLGSDTQQATQALQQDIRKLDQRVSDVEQKQASASPTP